MEERGVWVSLGYSEMAAGAMIGAARQVSSLLAGNEDQHGFSGDGWEAHIEGALAEMAAAKVLNCYWSAPVNTYRKEGGDGISKIGGRDVGVRRRSHGWYDMLIRNNDASDAFHICVIGKAPIFRVVGHIVGSEAKQDKWIKKHGGRPPAWFVPQSELSNIEELIAMKNIPG